MSSISSNSANDSSSCADAHEADALSVERALAQILAAIEPIADGRSVGLHLALGKVLQQPIHATRAVPAFDNAAVDGYGLAGADLPAAGTRILPCVGRIHAGEVGEPIVAGQCVRIMTGAPIPPGVDTVVMQEQVAVCDAGIVFDARQRPGQNVRKAGEDLAAGEAFLPAGRRVTVADVGLLASQGIAEIPVKRALRVAIVSTGNEIVGIGAQPGPGQLFDSNRFSLLAALQQYGDVEISELGIIADDPQQLLATLSEAAQRVDVLICSGGVSSGEADFTKIALQAAGQIHFWKIALKPGRPLAFGRLENSFFFGLPGNPVAVLVTFYQLVLPALDALRGVCAPPAPLLLQARASRTIRKKPGRTEFVRGIVSRDMQLGWQVETTGSQGSGILRSMSRANCFIVLPAECGTVEPGDWVEVQPFVDWR